MTLNEATALAVRILQTFQGPPTDVWEEELANLNAGRAGTAYARLRREHEHRWLSIAHFMHVYRSIHTDDASTRPDPCRDCDDTGWIPAPDRIWEDGRISHQWKPCRCTHGQQRAASRAWRRNQETA